MQLNKLTPEEEKVIIHKETERPFTGEYDDFFVEGTYVCRRCNTPLYTSDAKFHSDCGWPSFDQEIPGAVKKIPDADGLRTEIICNTCDAHLGHVFTGEGYTREDTRHCVNSISLKFIPKKQTIIFGGGCFWCMEAVFQMLRGVEKITSGYAGGKMANPTYEDVSTGKTGYVEVIQVTFDQSVVSLEDLLAVFFTSHDPTSLDRQGNDVGSQYHSAIYYATPEQKTRAEQFIQNLVTDKTFTKPIVTELKQLDKFYPAEQYHQNYYKNNHDSNPYCRVIIDPKIIKLRQKFSRLLK